MLKFLSRLFRRPRQGLSEDTLNAIRRDVYGLPAETKRPHPSCQTNEGKKGLSPEVERQLINLLHGLPAEKKED